MRSPPPAAPASGGVCDHRFRPGHPEISARNRTFPALAAAGRFVEGAPAAGIHPAVAPGPGDLVVTKRRVSAFTGSDLDVVLRGLGAGTLVLTGIATSGVVLSTLRQAADLDYQLASSPTPASTPTPRCTGS